MGIEICEECGCIVWNSTTMYFPEDPHAKDCSRSQTSKK